MKTDAAVPESKQNRKSAADTADDKGSFRKTEFGRQPVASASGRLRALGATLMRSIRFVYRYFGGKTA